MQANTFFSDAEANLVNLESFTLEDDKKNEKKKENNRNQKNIDEGFGNNLLFSTKEDLDMFGSNSLGKGVQPGSGFTPATYYNQPGIGVIPGVGLGQPNIYGAPPPNMMGYKMGVGAQYPPQYAVNLQMQMGEA